MSILLKTCLAIALLTSGMTASATVTWDVFKDHRGVQLRGAHNVPVLGSLYDVLFVGGTCIQLFRGCDELSDFVFRTPSDAAAAATALLDWVLIDTSQGAPEDFDSNPSFTSGCDDPDVCYIITPYQPTPADFDRYFDAVLTENYFEEQNAIDPFFADRILPGWGYPRRASSYDAGATFAIWGLVSTPIPEPTPLGLLAVGLPALVLVSRYRKTLAV